MELQSHHTVTGILKSHNTSSRRMCSQQPVSLFPVTATVARCTVCIVTSPVPTFSRSPCMTVGCRPMSLGVYHVQIGQLVQSLKWGSVGVRGKGRQKHTTLYALFFSPVHANRLLWRTCYWCPETICLVINPEFNPSENFMQVLLQRNVRKLYASSYLLTYQV
jgi:hypothetical protein